jgi:tRNA (guanine-N7-)-methyltransferase
LKRGIRSYVLRQGRTTPAQQRALDELSATYCIAYCQEIIQPQLLFGRSAPLVLEIGSGMGETTAHVAAQQPGTDFIAIEVHGPGVGSLLKRISEQRLTNLRAIRHDAVEVLVHMIPDASLAGLHLFFPDPWPKKRHHKRRLVQPAFAALAARKLAPGAYLHAATDWPEYAVHMAQVFDAEPAFERTVEARARPSTKFEQRGVKLGHEVRDLVYCRR